MVPLIPRGPKEGSTRKKSIDKQGIFKEKHQGQSWRICLHWSCKFVVKVWSEGHLHLKQGLEEEW
jgi:hypothetical protein